MEILIKYHNPICKLEQHGDWIDLKSAEDVTLKKGENQLISLGVAMKLPKYYEAYVVPRSGTYNKYGLIQANHYGIIDGPNKVSDGYSGNNDIWKFNAVAMRTSQVGVGDRICQFKIMVSMSAPWYVKLRWLFDNKLKFTEVDYLKLKDRGGFGKSGK